MQFSSLGSGSKGNGTLIRYEDCTILVDCGFTLKQTLKRLERLNVSAEQLDAIVVTHEHSDHLSGVGPLARKYKLPVYMTTATYRSRNIGVLPELTLIKNYLPFSIKSIHITPVAVPHDASEPAQFVFEANDLRLGILTDLGSITPHVEMHYQACDGLVLEANHDSLMLASGAYPPSLKQRVGGAWGHLNNRQAADFLTRVDRDRLKQLVIAHISHQNNSLALVEEAFAEVSEPIDNIYYACQNEGFDWISL